MTSKVTLESSETPEYWQRLTGIDVNIRHLSEIDMAKMTLSS